MHSTQSLPSSYLPFKKRTYMVITHRCMNIQILNQNTNRPCRLFSIKDIYDSFSKVIGESEKLNRKEKN